MDTSKTVDITARQITLDGSEFEVASRVYDGTTAVAATKKTGKDGLTDGGGVGCRCGNLDSGCWSILYTPAKMQIQISP